MDEINRLEKIMQEENMNAAQFSLETGIQSSTLSHILNGRNKMSLSVIRQILNRFPSISSDWLILGNGPMYRKISHAQSPDLFTTVEQTTYDSNTYVKSRVGKSTQETASKRQPATPEPSADVPAASPPPPEEEKPQRRIKRIIVFFDDNSFQEFIED